VRGYWAGWVSLTFWAGVGSTSALVVVVVPCSCAVWLLGLSRGVSGKGNP